ncbi:Protein involved in catabolism of external DNA [Hafnia alvei]|uniref:Protein involved in catabolism of external DNA n=1 Tax=Hafnia alvei TaxID=569 RepID=A0A377PD32_HAFAL|nr:Protein involved in catabolism of external DNA [Hafnia alvei]
MQKKPANTSKVSHVFWQRDDVPAELEAYLSAVKHFNRGEQLRYYPGSPLIARQLLRDFDKIHLTELHPTDFPLLRNEFAKDERAKVMKADGYQQLKSQLPPLSRRGFVLIDPPYGDEKPIIKTW